MEILGRVEQLRAQGRDVVSLCAGEPSVGAPAAVSDSAALLHITGTPALGYTSAIGTRELRDAIAGHYRKWYGLDVPPERVAVTTGSSGAFTLSFLAAFNPGDRVALASPGYPAYRNILTALGIEVVTIQTGPETRFQPTPALLDAAQAAHGPLHGLILASPANPTGTMTNRAELEALTGWCAAHGVRLVSDEIYHGITYPEPGAADPRGVSTWETNRSGLVISSFSKYWGMTGWRLGWALMPEDLTDAMEALAGNFSLCPPAPAQYAALGAFTAETYAERDAVVTSFARARSLLLAAHDRLGWGIAAPADGAFYYYADLGEQLDRWGTSRAYARALLDAEGVALVPGTDFDPLHGHRTVRLSFAAGETAVAAAIKRIVRFQE
ncbi:aminotransferase class I/II-fold pyridoxal phosphate-dependent enzyme [Klugiella xanthotipulae]